MPGLFGLYGLASHSLLHFQAAINTVGHNIANAGTEGFHRQRVTFRQGQPEITVFGPLGTGVRVQTVQRIEDRFIDLAVQREIPVLARYAARANSLAQAELSFGEPSDAGLTSLLDEFYAGWDDLATSPEDTAARESVVRLGISLTDSVRGARDRLSEQQLAVTGEIGRSIDDANRVIRDLRNINQSILRSVRDGVVPGDLQDRRDTLVETLGELVGASAIVQDNGTATVRINGRIVAQLEAHEEIRYDLKSGTAAIGDRTLAPADLDGRIGGLMQVRDDDLESAIRRLDEFAVRLANDVNAVHEQGTDLHGRDAEPFFVLLGVAEDGVGRAAAGIRINSRLLEDSTRVAAGGTEGDLDNSIALDIAALRNDRTGAVGLLQSLIVDVGGRAREAEDLAIGQSIVVESFRAQQQSVSGVSLDEEGAALLQFQRSYQAAARVMTTVDEMAQTILSL